MLDIDAELKKLKKVLGRDRVAVGIGICRPEGLGRSGVAFARISLELERLHAKRGFLHKVDLLLLRGPPEELPRLWFADETPLRPFRKRSMSFL